MIMIQKQYLLAISFSLIAIASASAKSYYVNPTGSGRCSGVSWAHASNNLQEMINEAATGDTICVAAGIYYGGFILKDGVCMAGGFNGSEASFVDRQLPGTGQNRTILDGGNKQRVLTQEKEYASRTVISGFIIQNGYALSGAGAYLLKNTVLESCIIRNNKGGSAAIGDYIESLGGVVFYANNDKVHLLAPEEYGKNFQSSVGGLKGYTKLEEALKDYDGKQNTSALTQSRAAKALSEYTLSTSTGDISDWYIPSIGEWSTLLSTNHSSGTLSEIGTLVNEALKRQNKTPIDGNRYWSSTAASTSGLGELWYADFSTKSMSNIHSLQYNKLRGARIVDATNIKGLGGGLYLNKGTSIISCLVYGNRAPEASAIYMNAGVSVYNSTIVHNQTGQKGGYAIEMAPNATLSTIRNTVLWNNHDIENKPLDFRNIPAYNCAAQQANTVVDQNIISLHENNENIAGPNFANPANEDFHLRTHSPCAKAGSKSNIPSRYAYRDIDGNSYKNMIDIPIGAFPLFIATGISTPSADDNQFIVTPSSPKKEEMMEIYYRRTETELFQMEILSANGWLICRSDFYSNTPLLLPAPTLSGIYIVNVSQHGVKLKSTKIVVH